MPKQKILVLGDHAPRGGRNDRAMNIACGVVIAVVIVAMIVATIVYFCVNKSDGNGNGNTTNTAYVGPPPLQGSVDPRIHRKIEESSNLMGGHDQSAVARFGQVPMGQAPATDGPIFPSISAEDEHHLAKTQQLHLTKNYAKGQKNAILTDMKYSMEQERPPVFRRADFFPYRGKDDHRMLQVASREARKYQTEFNRSDDYHTLVEDNRVPNIH